MHSGSVGYNMHGVGVGRDLKDPKRQIEGFMPDGTATRRVVGSWERYQVEQDGHLWSGEPSGTSSLGSYDFILRKLIIFASVE